MLEIIQGEKNGIQVAYIRCPQLVSVRDVFQSAVSQDVGGVVPATLFIAATVLATPLWRDLLTKEKIETVKCFTSKCLSTIIGYNGCVVIFDFEKSRASFAVSIIHRVNSNITSFLPKKIVE